MGIKNFILGVAIAVLTIAVAIYGIHTFYPAPEYSDFCNDSYWGSLPETEEICLDEGGRWNTYPKYEAGQASGYCNTNYYCSQEYSEIQKSWSRNLFYIGLPLGILIILLGTFVFKLDVVGAGLMWGGVITMIYSTWGFFLQSEQTMKFIISAIALALVIYFAYKFNGKKR